MQGHSHRLLVRVKPVANSGTLPLICECITSLSIGCLTVRSKLQKGLDSYQEEDLTVLRDRWSKALARRKQYLDEQIQKLINKQGNRLCACMDIPEEAVCLFYYKCSFLFIAVFSLLVIQACKTDLPLLVLLFCR